MSIYFLTIDLRLGKIKGLLYSFLVPFWTFEGEIIINLFSILNYINFIVWIIGRI